MVTPREQEPPYQPVRAEVTALKLISGRIGPMIGPCMSSLGKVRIYTIKKKIKMIRIV